MSFSVSFLYGILCDALIHAMGRNSVEVQMLFQAGKNFSNLSVGESGGRWTSVCLRRSYTLGSDGFALTDACGSVECIVIRDS